jgi:uncharacterized membrane protein YeaQ/YmgE (transglycosylase-associated protein family)
MAHAGQVVVRHPRATKHAHDLVKELRQKEMYMNWVVILVIGGIVGWLASILMKTNAQMGWIANVLVGIVGSALGFWLAGVLGIAPAGGVLGFVVAVLGAVVLIILLRALGVFRRV